MAKEKDNKGGALIKQNVGLSGKRPGSIIISRRLFLTGMISTAVLVLAGCGSGGSSGGSNYPSASTTSTSLGYPIVDTNQVLFYGNTVELTTDPTSSTDAFYGQDAQFTGNQPSYADNGDGTVTDNVTGLMWVQARGSQVSWQDAVNGASSCTTAGYSDWRMPTVKELYSLIEYTGDIDTDASNSVPYIDSNVFGFTYGPNTSTTVIGDRLEDAQDWTGTEYVSTTMLGSATAFGVNFCDGRIKGYPITNPATLSPTTHYVRYVRSNTDYGTNSFTDNGNGTVSDSATGLMWAQYDSGSAMDWETALAWVQTMNTSSYLGYTDWRLPNAKEMQSIVDYDRSPDTTSSAAIDPVFNCTQIINEGGNADYPWYWTGTTHLETGTANEAVYIAFGRALGWMQINNETYYTLLDTHGAGAQRTDPKSGSVTSYYLGVDINGNPVYGRGPQGDVVRIYNYARLVRG